MMLFNSYQFLFLFLPLTVTAYWLLSRSGKFVQQALLLVASLGFYGYWDIRFLALLIGSILLNFCIGHFIWSLVHRRSQQRLASWLLFSGVAINLSAIGVFKYAVFFTNTVNALAGTSYDVGNIILPLGISFFTFEQISFLVDVRKGRIRPTGLLPYALFVSFFPRVVAGPILRFQEIIPQLQEESYPQPGIGDHISVGLTIFFIGLLKKAVLADGISPYATELFRSTAAESSVDFFSSWIGVLAYTCQLYFDFSGYSDMAIGAARCFGIRFPMNFYSPYKATSIIEFWHRWHITLSRFLRDYLYIGLGGNRRGLARRYINLMLTMLLGGLWHGANWTFVAWGGLHGCYLVINHVWVAIANRSATLTRFRISVIGTAFGWGLTFLAVVAGWVFFRAPDLRTAFRLLYAMSGLSGFALPAGIADAFAPLRGVLSMFGITVDVGRSGSDFVAACLWVAGLLMIAFTAPNTQQLMRGYDPVLVVQGGYPEPARGVVAGLQWRISPGWAIASGAIAFIGIIAITHVSEFLYWQF